MAELTNPNWNVVHTRPAKESLVIEFLCQKQIECFYPSESYYNIKNRHMYVRPFFPRYVFARMCPERPQQLSETRNARGVLRLLEFGGKLAEIEPSVIEIVKQQLLEREAMRNEILTPELEFALNSIVRIISNGGMDGQYAYVRGAGKTPGKLRLELAKPLFGKQVAAEYAVNELVRATEAEIEAI